MVNSTEGNDCKVWKERAMSAHRARQTFMCQEENVAWIDKAKDGGNKCNSVGTGFIDVQEEEDTFRKF